MLHTKQSLDDLSRQRWSCWLCAAALLLFRVAAYGQSLQVQNWTTEEGLPQNSVHAVLQSSDGYLWLATESGVARFNGLRFTRFFSGNQPAFTSDDVCCLAEGQNGSVLFGTANEAVVEEQGKFHRIAGVRGQVLAMQRERNGAVLVLMADRLLRVRGDATEAVGLPGGASPSMIGAAADGAVLVAAGASLFRLDNGQIKQAGVLPVVPIALVEDEEHTLWIASAGEVGMFPADGPRAIQRWTVGRELPGSRVEMLRLWPGGVLVGTNRGAVVLHGSPATPGLISALANNAVLSAFQDRESDAWFGTDSAGLFALRPRVIGTVAPLANETVTSVTTAADGTLWVGTKDAGLRHLLGEQVLALPSSLKLSSQVVLALAPDSTGGVWVGSPEGLDHVQAAKATEHFTAADGLPDDFVRSLLALPDGTVWIGTRRGAARLRNGRIEQTVTQSDGLPSDVIGAMLRDRNGTLWIGTTTGLARLKESRLQQVRPQSDARLAVTALLQTADGTVWVGAADGLYAVDGNSLLPVAAPLLHAGIAGMVADSSGTLWFRTSGGIVRGAATALRSCVGQANCPAVLRQYGVADGMPSVDLASVGEPAATLAANGSLWFATRRGVAVVQPQRAVPMPVAPGIAIEQVLVDDHPALFQPELTVDAGKRRLEISFNGLSLRSPSQVRYRYWMEGFDRDWSPWSAANVAEYTNLPPGRLLFRVQAMSADGVVSTEDAVVRLRVHASFYRAWWFYALLLLFGGVLAYGLYWMRLRRVRRNYEAVLQERNRIAREIHDTLAQDFVAVSLQLEVTSQLLQVGATGAAQQQVDATRTLVRDGIQDARESIWALRDGGTGGTLPFRLGAVVQRTEHASLSITGAYRALPPSREREMFRIAKEAIGNAAHHAHPEHIVVDLVYSEDAVLLRVSDDGAGFDIATAHAKTGHYGVRGMRERATAMGGVLTIQSEPGQGASVELRLQTSGKQGAE